MRAQSSFEAISLFALTTVLLSVFMIYFGAQISSQAEEREYDSLRDVADTLRQEILIARQAGPGYERTIFIPNTSGNKRITFTVNYSSDRNTSSELIVKFDPPIRETIEAAQLLGPGVYGHFSGGVNHIRTYDGGVIVEPAELSETDAIGLGIVPEIAFAHIDGRTARLVDDIECEYALSNDWARQTYGGPAAQRIDVAWNVTIPGGGSDCKPERKNLGERFFFTDAFPDPLADARRTGSNVSCFVRYVENALGPPDALCSGTSSITDRIAYSEPVMIVNSPPEIEITNRGAAITSPGVDGEGTRSTRWEVRVEFDIDDPDPDDTTFNVSLVRDGTNAAFIDCGYNPCSENGVGGNNVGFTFDLEVPWPESGSCDSIDDLSFKIRVIEEDATSELYTLESVDFSDELSC